jgi:hypothetical protein
MMETACPRSSVSTRKLATFDMKGSGIDSRIGSLSETEASAGRKASSTERAGLVLSENKVALFEDHRYRAGQSHCHQRFLTILTFAQPRKGSERSGQNLRIR